MQGQLHRELFKGDFNVNDGLLANMEICPRTQMVITRFYKPYVKNLQIKQTVNSKQIKCLIIQRRYKFRWFSVIRSLFK